MNEEEEEQEQEEDGLCMHVIIYAGWDLSLSLILSDGSDSCSKTLGLLHNPTLLSASN